MTGGDWCRETVLLITVHVRKSIAFDVLSLPDPTTLHTDFPPFDAAPQVRFRRPVEDLRRFCFHGFRTVKSCRLGPTRRCRVPQRTRLHRQCGMGWRIVSVKRPRTCSYTKRLLTRLRRAVRTSTE